MAGDEPGFRDLFNRLPIWSRHAISGGICASIGVALFFSFIYSPLDARAADDLRQDATQSRQQTQMDRMSDAIATLSQTQAVQAATIANMQRQQDHTDTSLDRIEGKIDQMRRGR